MPVRHEILPQKSASSLLAVIRTATDPYVSLSYFIKHNSGMRPIQIILACIASRVGGFSINRVGSADGAAQPLTTQLSSSRRDVLIQSGGLAVASLLLGKPSIATSPLNFLVTGANSGVGFEASKRLVEQGHNLILACRTIEKATAAAAELKTFGGGNLIPAECDLASLKSIDNFVSELPGLLGHGSKIDVLCLNAGLSRNTAAKDCARTRDGFELTGESSTFV